MIKIIPIIVQSISPSFYDLCLDILSNNRQLIPILVIVWLILGVLEYGVELYLYVSSKKSLNGSSSYKTSRGHLPKFLSKWYEGIIEDDTTDKKVMINIYLKTILFYIIVNFIIWYFFLC